MLAGFLGAYSVILGSEVVEQRENMNPNLKQAQTELKDLKLHEVKKFVARRHGNGYAVFVNGSEIDAASSLSLMKQLIEGDNNSGSLKCKWDQVIGTFRFKLKKEDGSYCAVPDPVDLTLELMARLTQFQIQTFSLQLAEATKLKQQELATSDFNEKLKCVESLKGVLLNLGIPSESYRLFGKDYSNLAYLICEPGISLEEVIKGRPEWVFDSVESRRIYIEDSLKGVANTQPFVHVQGHGFYLPPMIHDLYPGSPLPEELATTQQGISCKFNGQKFAIEISLPTKHPLRGVWSFCEDRGNNQDIATLKLEALLNNEWGTAVERKVNIPHTLVYSLSGIPGKVHFDGTTVYQDILTMQNWKISRTQKRYQNNSVTSMNPPVHKDRQVIFVEPFSIGGVLQKPKEDYIGEYYFDRDLASHERLYDGKAQDFLYSDGKDLYRPCVSQELWVKNMWANSEKVGFFIASYKKEDRHCAPPFIFVKSGIPSQGLYHYLSITENFGTENFGHYEEKWSKLGEEASFTSFSFPCENLRPTVSQMIKENYKGSVLNRIDTCKG